MAATDQRIGTGDGTRRTFGLCKAYGDHERRIAKPVEGSVRVGVAGVEAGGFVLDHLTGEVTLATPPIRIWSAPASSSFSLAESGSSPSLGALGMIMAAT